MIKKVLKHLRYWWRELWLNGVVASGLVPTHLRALLMRASGLSIGDASRVYPRCFFGGPEVRIGSAVTVGHECFFDSQGAVEIGDRTMVGPRCMFITSTHEIGASVKRAGELGAKEIAVGEGCWFGANVTVLPGVTVGSGCVLGAGAVVNEDCDPDGLYVGVPARRVRDLP